MKLAFVAVAALLAVGAAATANPKPADDLVKVTIVFDNKISELQKNQAAVVEEVAKELCTVPKANVKVLGVQDRSKATNTESSITLACMPSKPGAAALEEVLDHCEDMLRRRNLNDEIGDRTMPDLEIEKIACEYSNRAALTMPGGNAPVNSAESKAATAATAPAGMTSSAAAPVLTAAAAFVAAAAAVAF